MANPTWPATLPTPLADSGQYAPLIENVITTNMETGAPKRRRRFTAVPETYTGSILVDGTQATALDTFVVVTLQDVLPFDWKDFRTGAAASYVFQKRPTYARVAGSHGLWRVSLELMMVPT